MLILGRRIYSAYFPTHAHNERIILYMDETPQVYLLIARILAESNAVDMPLMNGFFEEQLRPNRGTDPRKYWRVMDRTTGEVMDLSGWTSDPGGDTAHVTAAVPMHEYMVSFSAYIIRDPVKMYNHPTDDWGDKEYETPFNIYYPTTHKFVFDTFERWLKDSSQVNMVRFATFFY